ncbi:MAG TPA: DUF4384 domain-containing protein [Candidatus Obscuribacterales bacterium]
MHSSLRRLAALSALLPLSALAVPLAQSQVVALPDARQEFIKQLKQPGEHLNLGLAYWIELDRAKKFYRCNNKTEFKAGDRIRFHVTTNADGYFYVVLKQSSGGHSAVLFPECENGDSNFLKGGKDYVIPTEAWLEFDDKPGNEQVMLLLSRKPINAEATLDPRNHPPVVLSASESGSKDLVPRKARVNCPVSDPVSIPYADVDTKTEEILPSYSAQLSSEREAMQDPKSTSLTTVVLDSPQDVLSVNLTLKHR